MTIILYHLSNVLGFHALLYMPALGELENASKIYAINYITKINQTYKIIKYNKDILSTDLINEYGLFRSVIVNGQNKVICFSPPKCIPYNHFVEKYTLKNSSASIIAQDFVEGIMINVFWDSCIGVYGGWEIATRNTVGANDTFYTFHDSKTFHTMFLEACKEMNLYLHSLNPLFCYSFVLQHPEIRTVVPFKEARLYLVELYEIMHVDAIVEVKSIDVDLFSKNSVWKTTKIMFPETYEFTSYVSLLERFGTGNTPYNVYGVVLKNTETGERCKISNPTYEQVKQMRGIQPKIQFQYFVLRKQGKIEAFLTSFPEYKSIFSQFRHQLHKFTMTLYKNYISCFIRKRKLLKDISSQYKTHLVKIHQIYMNDLKLNRQHVNNTVVISYVNELHPSQQMFSVNYHMRKRMLDFIKADENIE